MRQVFENFFDRVDLFKDFFDASIAFLVKDAFVCSEALDCDTVF